MTRGRGRAYPRHTRTPMAGPDDETVEVISEGHWKLFGVPNADTANAD